MINFDEELKKFHPSLEIDDVEDNIYSNKPMDITDLLQEMLKEMRERDQY